MNIKALDDNAELHDKVLSIHHSTMITISSTKATKIIEILLNKTKGLRVSTQIRA